MGPTFFTGLAVAISIDYRRGLQNGAVKHHIIDPRTGEPAQTDLMSVSILAPDIIRAEAAAKAVLILGSQPKIYWFLSRGSAIAAYWLLWLSVAMGLCITNKMAQVWPGVLPAIEIHQFTALLGLAFALFHGLILTGDAYINISIVQALIPFFTQSYRPGWVGIGQVVFYLWAIIVLSFYVRKRIGKKVWRGLHYASYICFLGVLVHSLYSGTDTATNWSQYVYWFSGASLLLLTVYRVLISQFPVKNNHAEPLSDKVMEG